MTTMAESGTMAAPEIFKALVETAVKDLQGTKKIEEVVTVDHDMHLPEAFRVLARNNILAAPVIDSSGAYVGMVSVHDLVSKTLELMDQPWRPLRFSAEYLNKKKQFRACEVQEICHTPKDAKTGKYLPVNENFSLFHALEVMVHNGDERVATISSADEVRGVLTSSMFVDFLHEKEHLLGSLGKTKLHKIRPYGKIATLNPNRRALGAFEMMKDEKVAAVAITDLNGRMIDVVSARDLRGINPESLTFRFLWNTVDFYKSQSRDCDPDDAAPVEPVVLTSEDNLEALIEAMKVNEVHQVFIVDNQSDMHPLDLITISDVLKFILTYIQNAA